MVGAALGPVLYHAAFGFRSAWQVFTADRRGEGLPGQTVMLAIAAALFFRSSPRARCSVNPFRLRLAAWSVGCGGAFLSGIGMQPGGGCASRTLYTAGGGSTRMLIALAAFIAGSAIGAARFPWWVTLPSLPPVSPVKLLGRWTARGVHLVVFAAIALLTIMLDCRPT